MSQVLGTRPCTQLSSLDQVPDTPGPSPLEFWLQTSSFQGFPGCNLLEHAAGNSHHAPLSDLDLKERPQSYNYVCSTRNPTSLLPLYPFLPTFASGSSVHINAKMAAPKMTKNQMRRAKKKEQKKAKVEIEVSKPCSHVLRRSYTDLCF